MEEYLNDVCILKAIAVYFLKKYLVTNNRGIIQKDLATKALFVSPSLVSRWCQPKDKISPSAQQVKAIADYTQYSINNIVVEALSADDKYGLLKNSELAVAYRKKNGIGEWRTQDPSDAHITNLKTFSGHEYALYYLESDNHKRVSMTVKRVPNPKKSGCIEIRIIRGTNNEVYLGTIIAPPQIDRAFIYLSQKNDDGICLDRGMIVLYFPQERARDAGNYQCGVGVAMTMDRHHRHVLLQRVVLLQKDLNIDDDTYNYIDSFLNRPIKGENVLLVTDLQESQRELFSHILPPLPIQEHDSLFDS